MQSVTIILFQLLTALSLIQKLAKPMVLKDFNVNLVAKRSLLVQNEEDKTVLKSTKPSLSYW
ncbi:hypothetical protein BCT81_20550 [Vibrio sp. 10N.261.52.A1]|nr:hypothetical protein BCT81_20550 [Vibrio sp. 10N.261.52.A1]